MTREALVEELLGLSPAELRQVLDVLAKRLVDRRALELAQGVID